MYRITKLTHTVQFTKDSNFFLSAYKYILLQQKCFFSFSSKILFTTFWKYTIHLLSNVSDLFEYEYQPVSFTSRTERIPFCLQFTTDIRNRLYKSKHFTYIWNTSRLCWLYNCKGSISCIFYFLEYIHLFSHSSSRINGNS